MKQTKALTDSPLQQQQLSLPSSKLLDSTSPHSNFNSSLYYEPTSVLDPHLTSSPATAAPTAGDISALPWTDGVDAHHHHHHLLPPTADDWDSVSWPFLSDKEELSSFSKPAPLPFTDDCNAAPSFLDPLLDLSFYSIATDFEGSTLPPPAVLPNFDRSHLESLLRAAHCVDSNDLATANVILSRLNHQLQFHAGSPLQRAVFLFKEALSSLIRPSPAELPLCAAELVRRIAAQRAFTDLSPVPHFASFTATQTLLEAFDAGAGSIHLIDFELGLGGQWSSFAQELAARSCSARSPPPAVRITAIVAEESAETALAAENLRDFARGLGLRLAVSFVRVGGLGTLALEGIRLAVAGEPLGIVLTPAVSRLISCGGGGGVQDALLRFIRRSSPRVVVFVDTECGCGGASVVQPPSLRQSVASGVQLYAALLESLEAAAATTGAGEDPVRRVEWTVLRPKVMGTIGSWAGLRVDSSREVLARAGLAPVKFSEFTESQAELLVRRAHVDGFNVARRDGAMVLSWRATELAVTSAWRC